MPGDAGESSSWIPYAFAGLQTVITAVLGYISKLLRDIRNEITGVKIEMKGHEIMLHEQEKRMQMGREEFDRRIRDVEHRP